MRYPAHTFLAGAAVALCMSSLALADGNAVAVPALVAPAAAPLVVPANTPFCVHLTQAISSNGSKSGSTFTFVTVDPVIVGGQTVVAAGTTGSGTLILAGHAGYSGHEGDLTLRFDSVPTVDGQLLQFDDQRVEINGRNRKVMAFLGGFVPYVGLAAGFIRGSEMSIAPTTVIHTVTKKAASTTVSTAALQAKI